MRTLFQQAEKHSQRPAIRAGDQVYSYAELLDASRRFASVLLNDRPDLHESHVAFMADPGFDYVKVQWAIWQAGGVAVPLCLSYPLPSLRYVIEDTGAETVVVSPPYESLLSGLCREKGIRLIVLSSGLPEGIKRLPDIGPGRRAMILYTSGTTSLPKGVVSTHRNLEAQISTLVDAWEWSREDHIICVLPLHHVHGIVNVVGCALWAGACCEFLPAFSAPELFKIFLSGRVNVFMAVPTIYFKLIAHWEGLPRPEQEQITEALAKFRLMVSGSAALPVTVMERWHAISRHWLLERYGMTEIGMAISNPYRGERRPGHIGQALPGVQIRLCNEEDQPVVDEPGEIQVKGDNVFLEYWGRQEATEKSFTPDGWFKTGDVAEMSHGYYKILGRSSVDIIKSGGYKISALEIEEVLRTHPLVMDCSVVGVDNEEWGELVAAAVVSEGEISVEGLAEWLKELLPKYKIPRMFKQVPELPRNAMGKVTKNELKVLFK